jgi:hypothetical protein
MAIETHEIRTLEEYRAVAGQPVGMIGATDAANGRKVHRPSCRTISEETFREKVLVNGARNGRYYFFLRSEEGQRSSARGPARSACEPNRSGA